MKKHIPKLDFQTIFETLLEHSRWESNLGTVEENRMGVGFVELPNGDEAKVMVVISSNKDDW